MSPSNQFSQNDCGPIDPAKSPKTKGCYVLKCDPFLAYKHCLLCLFLSLCSPSQGLAPSISLSLYIFLSLFLYLSLSLSLSRFFFSLSVGLCLIHTDTGIYPLTLPPRALSLFARASLYGGLDGRTPKKKKRKTSRSSVDIKNALALRQFGTGTCRTVRISCLQSISYFSMSLN